MPRVSWGSTGSQRKNPRRCSTGGAGLSAKNRGPQAWASCGGFLWPRPDCNASSFSWSAAKSSASRRGSPLGGTVPLPRSTLGPKPGRTWARARGARWLQFTIFRWTRIRRPRTTVTWRTRSARVPKCPTRTRSRRRRASQRGLLRVASEGDSDDPLDRPVTAQDIADDLLDDPLDTEVAEDTLIGNEEVGTPLTTSSTSASLVSSPSRSLRNRTSPSPRMLPPWPSTRS